MRIVDSNTALASEFSVQESFKTSVSRETSLLSGDETVATGRTENNAEVSISKEGQDMLSQNGGSVSRATYTASSVEASSMKSISISSKEELQLTMLLRLLEGLTGKRLPMRLLAPDLARRLETGNASGGSAGQSGILQPANTQAQPVTRSRNTTSIENSYTRDDQMSFAATAQVRTADGKTIDLAINLSMSRSFASSQSISWSTDTEVRLCDPLVFNFNGRGVELLGETFNFDINNDGTSDQISLLAEGNGFLALDLNSDGAINNGGELFGSRTGNGFSELAAYDADSNGWIDENDDIFNKLQIMFLDKDGNQRLFALGELGVGAIYLGNAQSDFELRDEQNSMQGQITHTGFFLYESGNAGLVQNVNFRMYDTPTEPALWYDAAV